MRSESSAGSGTAIAVAALSLKRALTIQIFRSSAKRCAAALRAID
jgi:hypothetical protein